MNTASVQRREPAFVLVFSILSLGLYMPFWYHGIYGDLRALGGETPTGRGYWLDFLFVLLTLGIYGIWVDYRISIQLSEIEEAAGLGPSQDTSVITVILDIAAYFTVFFTNFVTSAIQQDQINRLVDALETRIPADSRILV